MRREQGGLRRARAFESELDRLCAGLDDLDGARQGSRAAVSGSLLPLERALRTAAAGWRPVTSGQGRRLSLHWEAGTAAVRADRRRLAQVLGNLLANAVEHGSGAVRLRGRRRGSKVVIEVVDDGPRTVPVAAHPDRGRGLRHRRPRGRGGRRAADRHPHARGHVRGGRAAGGGPVSAPVRRRRAVFLLALALACGGLAASEVGGRVAEVESRTGRPVPVVVAARDVEPGARVKAGDLAVRDVPSRFVPVDAVRTASEAIGARVERGLRRGAYLTPAALGAGGAPARSGTLRRGERAVQVAVAGGDPLSQAGGPGARVDVLVSTEPRDGAGRTFLALEDVELLALGGDVARRRPTTARDDRPAATATATLRVTQRQAVYLTAAQNFAREVRLLPRPAGDGGRAGRSAVSAAGL